MRCGQTFCANGVFFEFRFRSRDRIFLAADYNMGAIEGGDGERLIFDCIANGFWFGEHSQHRACAREFADQLASVADQFQPVFPAEDAGGTRRCVLANAVPHDDVRSKSPTF